MSKAPRLTGKQLLAALSKAGFAEVRVRGSHHFLRHAEGRNTVVPIHAGEILGPGLFAKILRDAELSVKELVDLLD
jgi:predicted RNA binding protein YcfA (HicA-like mRNA interferase family)